MLFVVNQCFQRNSWVSVADLHTALLTRAAGAALSGAIAAVRADVKLEESMSSEHFTDILHSQLRLEQDLCDCVGGAGALQVSRA